MTGNALNAIHACEQLAVYYERRMKNLHRAAEFARLALARVKRLDGSSRDPYIAARLARLEQRFLNRVTRLQHRMALASGATSLPLLEPRRTQSGFSEHAHGAPVTRKFRL
jgi:hypothetical protein